MVRQTWEPDCRLVRDGQIDFGLVRHWIYACLSGHGSKCLPNDVANSDPSNLILVDVHHRKLVRASPQSRYLALSYVWGQISMLQTTTANFTELLKEGALASSRNDIPLVI